MAGIAVLGGSVGFTDFVGVGGPVSRKRSAKRVDKAPVASTETRTGRLLWSSVDALFAECFPSSPSLPGIHPTKLYLYVDSVEVSPWPDVPSQDEITTGSVVEYTYAIATINYSTLPYDPSDFIKRHQSGSNEVILLPSSAWKWEGGADITTADLPACKHVPIFDHTFEYFRVPASKENAIVTAAKNLVGKVNRSQWQGATAETLLFESYESDFSIDSAGVKSFSYSFKFRERRLHFGGGTFGWNHFPRLEGGSLTKWQRIVDKDGNYVYDRTDDLSGDSNDMNFQPLFQ